MSKVLPSAFDTYRDTLSQADQAALAAFFIDFEHHNFMRDSEKVSMRKDFENAILACVALGVSLHETLKRLDTENLSGFYARPSKRWFPLDSAAKIYPFSMAHGRMAVFRLSAYLRQAVVPELLQMALTFTIKRFPSFATTVKRGFFWHYLDTAKRRYAIEPETSIPCRPLTVARSGSQSFRILYYGNRISVEFFHVLTDGFGGLVFLKTLLAEYLRLLGIASTKDGGTFDINETPSPRELTNEFARIPRPEQVSGFTGKSAVQLSGKLCRQKPCRVLHFKLQADALKAAAHRHSATVTAYMLALIFLAAHHATEETDGALSIQVPVNMRKFYPSQTLRNFSMYCGIRLPLRQALDAETIIPGITEQLNEKASQTAMTEMAAAAVRIVSALRYIPLAIKTPAVQLVSGLLSDRLFTTTLSNLGVVSLPPELAPYVTHMDAVMGPSITNRVSCAMISQGNTAVLSITKSTADPSFEEKLYALLAADGVTPDVEGSVLYED